MPEHLAKKQPNCKDTLTLGSRLDDCLFVSVQGQGGFTIPYQVLDPPVQRHLTIKDDCLHPFADPSAVGSCAADLIDNTNSPGQRD